MRDVHLAQQLHRARIFSVLRCLCGLQEPGWVDKDVSLTTLDRLLRYRSARACGKCRRSIVLFSTLSITYDPTLGMPMAEVTL